MSGDSRPIVFAYNADRGLFSALTDTAHKILSPRTHPCNLCAITHGALGMREEWRRFLESLDRPVRFLHRDEIAERPELEGLALPAILLEHPDGTMEPWIAAAAIDACGTIDELRRLITTRGR